MERLCCYPKLGPGGMGVQDGQLRAEKGRPGRRKTYSPEQIVKLLRQIKAGRREGKTVEETRRSLGVGESTHHRWRAPTAAGGPTRSNGSRSWSERTSGSRSSSPN